MTKQDEKVQVFSQTRLHTFMTCPRKEYYQFRINDVGITPKVPETYFVEGELGHYALKYFYLNKAMLKENMIKRIKKAIDDLGPITPEYDDELRQDLAAMVGACLAYKQIYKKDLTQYKILFVEQEFEIVIAGYTFKGKLDLGVQDKADNTEGFFEHKFLSQFSINNYNTLPLNIQQLIYCLGFKKIMGRYPKWYRWNIIKKSQLRRKGMKAAKGQPIPTPEHLLAFEARCTQQYLDEPEKMFFRPPPRLVEAKPLENIEKIVEAYMAQWLEAISKPPLMNLSACEGKYNNACTFAPACTAFMAGHKDGWNAPECTGMYKLKEVQHPELEEDND